MRSATYTIKGYFYQFEKSIFEMLSLPHANDSLVVEGLEDVDVDALKAELIQCKYHGSITFADTHVRKPILELILSRRLRQGSQCTLYAHFGEEQVMQGYFTADRIKKLLTYRKRDGGVINLQTENKILDDEISDFANNFRYVPADDFGSQHVKVLEGLQQRFHCDRPTAEYHYYPNALHFTIAKASNHEEAARRITRKEFETAIDNRQTLFDAWLLRYEGEEKFKKIVRSRLRSAKALHPSKSRCVIVHGASSYSLRERLKFIATLTEGHFAPYTAMHTAKPWTFVLDQSAEDHKILKANLLKCGLWFNDGYEGISFSGEAFNSGPLLRLKERGGRQTDVIAEAAFRLRILRLETAEQNALAIRKPDIQIIIGSGPELHEDAETFRIPDSTLSIATQILAQY